MGWYKNLCPVCDKEEYDEEYPIPDKVVENSCQNLYDYVMEYLGADSYSFDRACERNCLCNNRNCVTCKEDKENTQKTFRKKTLDLLIEKLLLETEKFT